MEVSLSRNNEESSTASDPVYAPVVCCLCGSHVPPSPHSVCLSCLAQQVDITEGVGRTVVLPCCRFCGRYMHSQKRWLFCGLESRELLALTLQKIRGLKKMTKIVDCHWMWTEPHSKRVKLKLCLEKDVLDGRACMRQSVVVQGIIQSTQCDDCQKSFTPHAGWNALVQVRQHADHKRTLLYLEQLILKNQLSTRITNVIEKPDGLDFCFPSRQTAQQFAAFCESRFPCSTRQSKQLVSHDANSNSYFHKYTISLTLPPLCRDDLVYIPRQQAQTQLGGFPSLALCTRVTGAGFVLLDPFTTRSIHISAEKYWRTPFHPLCTRKHLSSFLVLDVSPVDNTLPHCQQQQQQNNRSERRRRRRQKDNCCVITSASATGNSLDAESETVRNFHSSSALLHVTTDKKRKRARGKRVRELDCSDVHGISCIDSNIGSDRMPLSQCCNNGVDRPGGKGSELQLSEVELLRGNDLGVQDRRILTRTHLGTILKPGDWVQGYDLRSINLAGGRDCELESDAHWCSAVAEQQHRERRHRKGRRRSSGGDQTHTREVLKATDSVGKCAAGMPTADVSVCLGQHTAEKEIEQQIKAAQREMDSEVEVNALLKLVNFEVVIVKKQLQQPLCAGEEGTGRRKNGIITVGGCSQTRTSKVRPWVLQRLLKEQELATDTKAHKKDLSGRGQANGRAGAQSIDEDMEAFKDELEENAEMRAQVNLWRDPRLFNVNNEGQTKKTQQHRQERGSECEAAAERGHDDTKAMRRVAMAAFETVPNGAKEKGHDFEDISSKAAPLGALGDDVDDTGVTGVRLAELLEGLSLENGEIKGANVRPGEAATTAAGITESAAEELDVPKLYDEGVEIKQNQSLYGCI